MEYFAGNPFRWNILQTWLLRKSLNSEILRQGRGRGTPWEYQARAVWDGDNRTVKCRTYRGILMHPRFRCRNQAKRKPDVKPQNCSPDRFSERTSPLNRRHFAVLLGAVATGLILPPAHAEPQGNSSNHGHGDDGDDQGHGNGQGHGKGHAKDDNGNGT